jgi:hypothetical protein
MKTRIVTIRTSFLAMLWLVLSGYGSSVHAQCNNNTYSISTSGIIYQVDTTTMALTAISGAAPGANFSNAMGYNGATNTFYFFSASGLTGCPTCITFYSYTPTIAPAGIFTSLSMVNGPTGAINTGCISFNGAGYYCINTSGYLYYYNILLNTWTTIATTIKDQWGSDITSVIAAYSSGDMAFDGNGNLFLLVGNSSTNKYGLYRLPPVVPTTNVGTITVQQLIAPGASMPDNSVPVGISFTPSGTMFISTLLNDMYAWRDIKSAPVLKGTFAQNIFDLSSCSLPMSPLPVHFTSISADLNLKNEVNVTWNVDQQINTSQYFIQRSNDGLHWSNIGTVPSNKVEDLEEYSYLDFHPAAGNNYYRIKEVDIDGTSYYSGIKKVNVQLNDFHIWPNPANDVVFIDNNTSDIVNCRIISNAGQQIKYIQLHAGTNTVDLKGMPSGTYVFTLQTNLNQYNKIVVKQ